MRVDPRVCRIKFDKEVERLRIQSNTLRNWGVFVAKVDYPDVELVCVPRHPLKISFPVEVPPGQIQIPDNVKAVMGVAEISCLAGRAFGARIGLDDFDQRAPSVVFCDPWTWELLPYEKLFRANHVDSLGKASSVLLGAHPTFKRPFLCMRGIREYHEHPQHTGDEWALYRKHMGLFSAVNTIWKTCILNANPNVIFQPPNINVNWSPADRL